MRGLSLMELPATCGLDEVSVDIDFLAIGHATHDRTPDGYRRGGTVCYAAVTARRLGRRPGILTRASADGLLVQEAPGLPENVIALPSSELKGISIHLLASPVSTTFVNIYRDGRRTQVLETRAEPIGVADLPTAWSGVPIVLLGPIAGELGSSWADQFPNSIMGVTPQGWMRKWDDQGHVSSARWEGAEPYLRRADAVILSREDVGGDDAAIGELASRTRTLLVTDGWHPVELHCAGMRFVVPARPAQEIDPTGAGDVFAAGYLIGLAETGDPLAAARFAVATASMSVEGLGMAAIPDRARVDEWLSRQG
jgi:pfkB family carbohydrate kinase